MHPNRPSGSVPIRWMWSSPWRPHSRAALIVSHGTDSSRSCRGAGGPAGAFFPATGTTDRPTAVVLVDQDDWQSAIAASVLAGPPIGAAILLSDAGELPAVTEDTLERLDPRGSDLSEDAQVIRIGPDVARPDGYKTA